MKIPPPKRIISEIDPKYDNADWRTKKLKVGAYIRVSTDSSDQANSLRNQLAHYERFIPANPNWEYVGYWCDDGISGTNMKNRKGLLGIVKASKAAFMHLYTS